MKLNGFSGGYSSNPYFINEIKGTNAVNNINNRNGVEPEETVNAGEMDTPLSKEETSQTDKSAVSGTSNPNEIIFDFKRRNNFNLVSATSKVEDVDIEKEKEVMKKEVVLDRYKFFVQPANLGTDEDGTVRLKNFKKI